MKNEAGNVLIVVGLGLVAYAGYQAYLEWLKASDWFKQQSLYVKEKVLAAGEGYAKAGEFGTNVYWSNEIKVKDDGQLEVDKNLDAKVIGASLAAAVNPGTAAKVTGNVLQTTFGDSRPVTVQFLSPDRVGKLEHVTIGQQRADELYEFVSSTLGSHNASNLSGNFNHGLNSFG